MAKIKIIRIISRSVLFDFSMKAGIRVTIVYTLYMFLYINGLQNIRVAICMVVLMVGGYVLTEVFKNHIVFI